MSRVYQENSVESVKAEKKRSGNAHKKEKKEKGYNIMYRVIYR
jgi:hypothetical protein